MVKGIILLFIIGTMLGLGFIYFINPIIEETENVNLLLSKMNIQIAEARDNLITFEQTDEEYKHTFDKTQAWNGFYHEMTSIEAIREVQRILNGAFDGNEQTGYRKTGILVSPIHTSILKFEESDIYERSSVSKRDEQNGVSDKSELTLKEAIDALNADNTINEHKSLLDFIKKIIYKESVEVGIITASFNLSLTYNEYLYFIDYLCGLPETVSVDNMIFKDSSALEFDNRDGYNFDLNLYIFKGADIT